MIESQLLRKYRLKFYLNMNHYIIINGKRGQTHPHTWEFLFEIVNKNDDFIEFRAFERTIEDYMAKYQEKILNEVKPFDTIVPTIENVTDYFSTDIRELMRGQGGELVSVEGSETPTRSYIVNFDQELDFRTAMKDMADGQIHKVIENVLDEMLGE